MWAITSVKRRRSSTRTVDDEDGPAGGERAPGRPGQAAKHFAPVLRSPCTALVELVAGEASDGVEAVGEDACLDGGVLVPEGLCGGQVGVEGLDAADGCVVAACVEDHGDVLVAGGGLLSGVWWVWIPRT